MLKRLAVAGALVVVAACGGSGDVTGLDSVVIAAEPTPAPTPEATPTPAPSPTPVVGPTYWRAWFGHGADSEGATLYHANLSGHQQHVRVCVYRDDGRAGMVRLWTKGVLAWQHETINIAPPSAAHTGEWGHPPITLQLYGLVGAERSCPLDPRHIGNITARKRLLWN